MIFLTVTSSWTAAIMYDRRQKKKNQKKWCDLVAHIAQQPLPPDQMARKLTVFISAPPGDGIRPSREYFKEYVKPILVAAAMDYDVIEGRKEGDVRYGTAEQIRRSRRRKGEPHMPSEDVDTQQVVEDVRAKLNISAEPGPRGDLVLGRHTWKEYIRGLHEGWLGPIDAPLEPEPQPEATAVGHSTREAQEPDGQQTVHEADGKTDSKPEEKVEEKPEEKKKKPYPPPAYLQNAPQAYAASPLPPSIPDILEPSEPIYQYHLLGFLKTPVRIWRYLNQRKLADDIGRQTAAIVLAAHRPYLNADLDYSAQMPNDASPSLDASVTSDDGAYRPAGTPEQSTLFSVEEETWHKSVRKPRKEGDETESVWLPEMITDPRILSRMRRFELDPEEEARANRIGTGEEKTRAYEVRDLRKELIKKDLAYEDD
jgi:mitochondrial import inner membrane translocase subunit TIM54